MKLLYQSFLLVIAFIFIFAWSQSILVNITVQFLASLILIYFLISFIRRRFNPAAPRFGADSDIILLTIAIFLLVVITGNIYSPLFFLLYFLGFGITFIFNPITVIIFVLGTLIVFMPEALKNGSIESYLRLASIVLIAPLAFFFGEDYRDKDEQHVEMEAMKEREMSSADTIAEDVKDVLEKEKVGLKPETVEKLNEVLEETETLREESKSST